MESSEFWQVIPFWLKRYSLKAAQMGWALPPDGERLLIEYVLMGASYLGCY